MNLNSLNNLVNFADSLKDTINELEQEVNKNLPKNEQNAFNHFFQDIKKSVKGKKDIDVVLKNIQDYANSRQKNI